MPSVTARQVRDNPMLTGQKALVTGANTGIGKAIAIALGKAGADVAVNYLHGDKAACATVQEIRQTGVKALAHRAVRHAHGLDAELFENLGENRHAAGE